LHSVHGAGKEERRVGSALVRVWIHERSIVFQHGGQDRPEESQHARCSTVLNRFERIAIQVAVGFIKYLGRDYLSTAKLTDLRAGQ
jgi:hypothetical protein